MDWRLLLVLLPLAFALGWVFKNVGQDALNQGKDFISK
ncbi:MAG: photosystem II protein Y [Leptolyngbyaceae cyanobacterium CRU_2_3]|nr:photosystem II protein Y [Leptolyngbyaceae cyanobacterium CRU_2_3]